MSLNGMAARISAIVNRAGQSVTYKRVTGQSFNASTGVNTVTYTNYTLRASVRDYHLREITGNIRIGDRAARIAAADIDFFPQKDDKIVVESTTYSIISIDQRMIGNDAGLYIMQIRGA